MSVLRRSTAVQYRGHELSVQEMASGHTDWCICYACTVLDMCITCVSDLYSRDLQDDAWSELAGSLSN